MSILRSTSNDWIDQVFSAKAVERGAVIRRAVPWVEKEIGRVPFVREVRRRGYTLLEAGTQFIVICNQDPVRRIV